MLDIHEKYAKLLVSYSLSLKAGDQFVIAGSYLAEDLVKAVYEEALAAGAHPELRIGINGTEKIFYDNASDEQLKYVSPLLEYVAQKYDASLMIRAPFNMKELESVDPAWGAARIKNLMAAWHSQLLEVLGAMGIREVRRLRGEMGRAMFFEDLEKEVFTSMGKKS